MLDHIIDGDMKTEDIVIFLKKHVIEHFKEEKQHMQSINY